MSKKEQKEYIKRQKNAINTAKHAEYEERQKHVDAPFGKEFKTGAQNTNKKKIYKRNNKIKDW